MSSCSSRGRETCGRQGGAQATSSFMGSMPNLETSKTVGTPIAEIESQTPTVRDDALSQAMIQALERVVVPYLDYEAEELRQSILYWWLRLKREVVAFVSHYLTFQEVKAEHQLPFGLLQPVKIPQWKWERVTMDFVSGLPLTPTKKDSVQTNGQSKRVIQILEDMLRGCVIDFQDSWEDYLSLAKFAYNNSFESSIQMAPYEALYGHRCCSPLCWMELSEHQVLGLELVSETENNMKLIKG
ncbi:uncharacterized protein LOC105786888 [Gossypium raimondii]|uniref:uncharacterized protein LOC105786888 n=1 Tax=Gossypium raimondii TaxID=29730 RepID=UPI00063AF0C5|nr:uncharacterized protein LOC105786888 [Gossypium raimondii]